MSSVQRLPAKAPPKKAPAGVMSHPKKGPATVLPRKAAPTHRRASGQPCRLTPAAAGAANKNASCEIDGLASKGEPALSAENAWAKMEKVRMLDGALSDTTWTPKGVATLEACLTALDVWGNDHKLCDAIRYRLKQERGNRRALNQRNPYLVAIHCCHKDLTPAQRSECSRFSKVVEVAYHEKVKPSLAETWLKSKSQAEILEEARKLKGKKCGAPRAVVASSSVRPHIWKAIKAGDGKIFDLAVKLLDALDKSLAGNF